VKTRKVEAFAVRTPGSPSDKNVGISRPGILDEIRAIGVDAKNGETIVDSI
jgi:hypothetical protein